ncbi:MAG: methyltransferase domain-containing protein [Bauldia sp.]|nr:MAG: methyltransferase domain-containing protein [Bauldia sp.]
MRIEYHRTLVADRVRNAAFHEALARVIRKGETTVADIGAGTGILGFMAARLGARSVTLYEQAEVIEVARRIAKRSGIKGCRFVAGSSLEAERPEKVDVVVSETLGNYALEEDIVETLNDAHARFLKPGGTLIPASLRQFVAPVTAGRFYDELVAWNEAGYGIDFSEARIMSLNNIYVRSFAPADLLDAGAAAAQWDEIRFDGRASPARRGEARWKLQAPATIFGLALWWSAELVPGVGLGTGPLEPKTHWEQLYLPVLEPLSLREGESLRARLKSVSTMATGTDVAWTIAAIAANGAERARQRLDLAKGFLP